MKQHIGHYPSALTEKPSSKLFVIVLALLCMTGTNVPSGIAQVAPPITPSGLSTQVNLASSPPAGKVQYDITGGTRPGGGGNLFHSFGNFNLPNNNIANFLNAGSVDLAGNPLAAGLPTANILGRVTGGNVSNILGMIQTTNFGSANLFLMNPAGFLFGPNASVNVGGMVSFSSADYLRLADGKLFNAAANQASDAVLSTAPVAAYGFLGSNPGAITVQGSQLTVKPGQSISMVGGNITIQSGTLDGGTVQSAKLSAPGGQVNLASVASPGEILAGTLAFAPNTNGQSFGALGSINVSQQSVIDVSGNGGGTVLIRGGNFVLDSSTISANATGSGPVIDGAESIGHGINIQVSQNAAIKNGAILETNVLGNVTPGVIYGGVEIQANQIEIAGAVPFPVPLGSGGTGIRSDVGTNDQPNSGNSGNISLTANSILMKGDAILETDVHGTPRPPGAPAPSSKAGDITLTANNNIELNGTTIQTHLFFDSGTAGNITLTSKHGSILETGNSLPPGFVPTPGVPIPPLTLNLMFNQSLNSAGKPGNYTFNAPEGNIQLAGAIIGIQILPTIPGTPVQGAGGGQVNITANNLGLVNNSSVQMDNFSGSPVGNFNVILNGNLTVNSSRIITTARAAAPAAALNITAHDVLVTHGSLLSTETQSAGNAGHLTISADTLQVTDGGRISSGTVQAPPFLFPDGSPPIVFPPPTGGGGTITVQGLAGSGSSASSVLVDGAGSGIFTNTVGIGSAGNTNISAQSLTIQNGGTLSAATSGTTPSATGGTITVNANEVQLNSGGLITAATTGAGAGGSVNINAGNTYSSNAGTVSSTTTGAAPGGNINIAGGSSATLTNGATVSASSTGQGSAGNIHISAGNFTATNSSVTTEANQSSGGIIKITTGSGGTVQLTDSKISASVLDGVGGGGSVNIDPQFVILENSQIIANSVFGPGGNINITTNLLLPDTASIISASSQFGQQGNIVIQSPISPASGKIIPLSQKPLVPTTLLSQRCAALAAGNVSSFTVAGRDSLPAEPGGWVSSPLALTAPAAGEALQASSVSRSEDRNEPSVISVRKIAPAGFLTQSFAGSTDCAS